MTGSVKWSGNGRWIFFSVTEDGRQKIKRMPAEGGAAETVWEGSLGGFSVHPSGSRILVVQSDFNCQTWALDSIANVSLK